MTIIDISLELRPDLPVWPGERPVAVHRTSNLDRGDEANVSELSLCVHSGTHVDAPSHFVAGGESVEDLALEVLMGPVSVRELEPEDRTISAEDLAVLDLPPCTTRLLLKTPNSQLWADRPTEFTEDYVALSPGGAEWLAASPIRLIGLDYLSVQRYSDPDPATHLNLLRAGVIIVEGLDLSPAVPGEYELVCLPIKIEGAEGAPARAVLIDDAREKS